MFLGHMRQNHKVQLFEIVNLKKVTEEAENPKKSKH
jgi:hypothetical protein